MKRIVLYGLVAFASCKTTNPASELQSTAQEDGEYVRRYTEVIELQGEARTKYAALQSMGITAARMQEKIATLAERIAQQYPDKLNPGNFPSKSIFMSDFSKMKLDSAASTQMAALNEDFLRIEDFLSTWDKLLFKRAHVLTMAHWRSVNQIYKALPENKILKYEELMHRVTLAYIDVLREMKKDENGRSVWRKSYIGSKDSSVARENRLQGADNSFVPYFQQTNQLLSEIARDPLVSAEWARFIRKILYSASNYQPIIFGSDALPSALDNFVRDSKADGGSFWDEFYTIFNRYITESGGSISIAGQPLPKVQGRQVMLPANTLPGAGEAGYKRGGLVDTVIFLGNHENPLCVTFVHTPILNKVGLQNGTVVTTGQNAFLDGRFNLPAGLGPKVVKLLNDSSDFFGVQQHGLALPGNVSESIDQFRQAQRFNKNLVFLFPQGDNPHGHGGEAARLIPTNAEFLPRMLSRLRETGEIHRFAIVPYGISSMDRLLDPTRPGDPSVISKSQTNPFNFRIEVGHTMMDYEVELLMNMRYRGILDAKVPSGFARLIQYFWVEDEALTYKDYPAGIVDLPDMIQNLINPPKNLNHVSSIDRSKKTR